jgi:hypothetical protein
MICLLQAMPITSDADNQGQEMTACRTKWPERIAMTGDRLAFTATHKEATTTAAPSQALNCLEHIQGKNARPPEWQTWNK